MTPTKALLLLPALLFPIGCDDAKTQPVTATRERSQAVLGVAPTVSMGPEGSPKSVATATPRTTRKLCGGAFSTKGPEVSADALARRQATGERELPERIDVRNGTTWINFWAAWCVPCKEEIPLLLEWERKLRAQGENFKVVFVSLDDDERQLATFLEQQPMGALRRSYWLTEGVKRVDWLGKVGMKADMELPAHVVVDSTGTVRCKIQGAIEPNDFSPFSEMLHGAR